MNCSICNNEINDRFGNNAEPVNNGRCCSDCNSTVVIPTTGLVVEQSTHT